MTPPYSPVWDALNDCCKARNVTPAIVTCPNRCRSHASKAVRKRLVLDLIRKGFSAHDIMDVWPASRSTVYEVKS